VAKDMVLTAAHCITPRPKSTSVTIKRFDLNNTDVGEVIMVKDWIVHKSYDDHTLEFDYALLVLERATTQDIKLIRLNADENFPSPGTLATVMGWGYTDNDKTDTDIALVVDTTVISSDECQAKRADQNETAIADFHICTFKQGQSMCQGDSGEIELLS
jgi:trypsin